MLDKGTMVAGYRVDGILGEGGMGIVYRATQLSLDRTVALKVLSAEFGDDPAFRERFRREGMLQAAIDHPHIVTVYEAGETEHGLFLAMRLVRGPTLKDMILSRELDAGRSTRILGQVADALDRAHDVGLTHRDVKPQNILVGARDHAYLADFGLTKAPGETGLTETGQFVGTIDYVSPEQVRGEGATDRSDVYALTAVLYECLTGAVPYPRPTEPAVVYAHISDPPPQVSEKRSDLPAELDGVIAKGMAKDPEERYGSARELMRATEQTFGKTGEAIATPAPPLDSAEEAGVRSTAPGATAASTAPGVTAASPGVTAASPVAGETAPRVPSPQTAAAPGAAAPPAAPPRDGGLPVRGLALAGVLALGVVGFLVGSSGSEEEDGPALTSSASAGSVALSFPETWRRVQEEPAIPGIEFSEPIVLSPGGGGPERLVAGQVAATGPALLPRTLLARLDSEPPRDDAVRLGKTEAYRYSALKPEGLDGQVTLYTAPTSGGVATIGCVTGPRDAPEFQRDCEEIATTLELSGVRTFALGPSEEYASALGDALSKLESASAAGVKKLNAAETPTAQATAASGLAKTYDTAARTVSRIAVSPADEAANARIAAALRRLARDYRSAASAARAGDSAAYASASRAVRTDGTRLSDAIEALGKLGYSVP